MEIKRILIAASFYLTFYIAIQQKNYVQVGEVFGVIKGDDFDYIFRFLSLPGFIPTFLMIVIIFQNIHDFPWWFLEFFSLIFNCIFYGYMIPLIANKFRQ
jgi:hypothetical protein